MHISKKPKMQKKEVEEPEEAEKPNKKELTKREKKEQKRKEKKKRDEKNDDEDADLLEDEMSTVTTPLSPGMHVPLSSPPEQEKEQKEKHYKDSLTAIAVNCEVVIHWRSSPDHPRKPHEGRDASPQRDFSTERSGGAGEGR